MATSARSKANEHFLEPLKRKVKKRRFVVFDIESKDDDSQRAGFTRPFLAAMFDPLTSRYREFRNEPHLAARSWEERHIEPGGCIDKLMTSLLSETYAGVIAYAHNMGSFDGLFVLAWLERHRDLFMFEVVPVQSSIQAIRIWQVPEQPEDEITQRWEILDSMKLLPMGLEKACKAMGVPGKKDHDLHRHEDDPSWSFYLEQDCRALGAVMVRFYGLTEDTLGGEVGMTTPSTSMRLFRRRFLGRGDVQQRIPRYKHFPGCEDATCDGCLQAWIRLGYYGGRTEIHHFYGELLRYFDFNSSYAASMNADMPIGDLVIEEGRLDWRRHPSQGGRYAGFCECTVEIPEECPIPPLPHRDKKTGKLIFPVGRFHGVWSVEELALLSDPIVGGRVVHVVRTVWYGLRPMFQDMVRELFRLRDKRLPGYDEGLSLLAKLFVNGLYGKFAMRLVRSMVVFANRTVEHPSAFNEVTRMQCFLCKEALPTDQAGEPIGAVCKGCEGSKPASPEAEGVVWYRQQKTDADYIIPQISAHITATARVRLWRTMRDVISSDAGERTTADKLTFGDVVLVNDRSYVVLAAEPAKGGKVELTVRGPDEDDPSASAVHTFKVSSRALVVVAGRIMYLDTDSVITNVLLPSSEDLGALKDEYPGETLTYRGLQAKAYLIVKTSDVAATGDLSKGKVTLKGFPREMRTPEHLDRLRKEETLEWRRLQKVRTLARGNFQKPPRMERVTKSLQSDYDKRVPFGKNGTRAVVLDEPVGGVDAAAE